MKPPFVDGYPMISSIEHVMARCLGAQGAPAFEPGSDAVQPALVTMEVTGNDREPRWPGEFWKNFFMGFY